MNSLVKWGGGILGVFLAGNIMIDGPLELVTAGGIVVASAFALGKFGGKAQKGLAKFNQYSYDE